MVPRSMAAVTDLNPPHRTIRTETHRDCPLCGQPGDVLYRDLTDRLFSAPGVWNFRRCCNAARRHVWLDPQPVEEDIPLIYNDYYTHDGASDSNGEKNAAARSASIIHRVPCPGYRGVLKLSGMTRPRRKMYSYYLTDHGPGHWTLVRRCIFQRGRRCRRPWPHDPGNLTATSGFARVKLPMSRNDHADGPADLTDLDLGPTRLMPRPFGKSSDCCQSTHEGGLC